mmetsp:Transcript_55944/g.173455  ORF Transcript_55944/g.173455 Transcript_55944/m.173455 type:complete len:354 (-) Transcript_55944:76-1137(-)
MGELVGACQRAIGQPWRRVASPRALRPELPGLAAPLLQLRNDKPHAVRHFRVLLLGGAQPALRVSAGGVAHRRRRVHAAPRSLQSCGPRLCLRRPPHVQVRLVADWAVPLVHRSSPGPGLAARGRHCLCCCVCGVEVWPQPLQAVHGDVRVVLRSGVRPPLRGGRPPVAGARAARAAGRAPRRARAHRPQRPDLRRHPGGPARHDGGGASRGVRAAAGRELRRRGLRRTLGVLHLLRGVRRPGRDQARSLWSLLPLRVPRQLAREEPDVPPLPRGPRAARQAVRGAASGDAAGAAGRRPAAPAMTRPAAGCLAVRPSFHTHTHHTIESRRMQMCLRLLGLVPAAPLAEFKPQT